MSFGTRILVAVFAGIASHVCLFIRGEWHLQAPTMFKAYFALFVMVVVLETRDSHNSSVSSLSRGGLMFFAYCTSLFASMVVYRKFFHSLRKFPGPALAGLTKFWHTFQNISSKNHVVLESLYQQYGTFIRTGPSELTICTPEVFAATDGPGNLCTKAVWYDFLVPEVAVNTTRNKTAHDQRRRIWDKGFSTKALEYYHRRTIDFVGRLDSQIAAISTQGESVNVSDWFYWLSFDIMGEFAFGKSFRMLENEEWHVAIRMLRSALRLLGPFSSVPWLAQIGFALFPNVSFIGEWHAMLEFCKNRMKERIEMDIGQPDVASWLIDASRRNNSLEKDRHWLNGDAIAIIIAGSDTVAPTLVYLFYELALHPDEAFKLFLELQSTDISDYKQLQGLSCLNGFINETLRFHPPVPTGGYRETPACGIVVAGQYVPGGVTIVAPRYTIGRLETCFEKADQFIPGRWYENPDMVKDKRAFQPFSQGRYSCVGKNLALSEIRYVTALLVKKYDISFAPGEDGSKVEGEMRDQFTAAPGSLRLRFRKRSFI